MLYSRRQAWFALGVLFAINLMNFYDRQIIGAVMEPIRKDWNLSDKDVGILGTAFVLVYAAVGVPLGRLSDRFSRARILSGGITVWSLLTAASGAAWSYGSMFAARLGVGIGEASCAPAANSLVGDLFPPQQRARALAIFMLGLPLGIFFSNWLSGTISQFSGWRTAFYVACIPGLICAVLTLFIREPQRGEAERRADESAPAAMPQRPGSPYLLILCTPTIVWIVLSGALHNFNMYALNGFVPALIGRYYGLTNKNAGLVAGVILGAVGIVGLLGGGWVADRAQRLRRNGRLFVAGAAMLLSAPCLFIGVSQPPGHMQSFMAWVGLGVMLMYVYYAGVYAAIQDVVEPSLRGTAMALYFFVMYVLGGAFGTYVLGWLSDSFAFRAMTAAGQSLVANRVPEQFRAVGLHQAMYIVPLLCFVLALVLFAASRTVTGDMQKLADWYEEASAADRLGSEFQMPEPVGSKVPLPEAT
jgi:MFS family permease